MLWLRDLMMNSDDLRSSVRISKILNLPTLLLNNNEL